MANETLASYYGFTPGETFEDTFSPVSFEGILFYIIASAIYVVEALMDVLRENVDGELDSRLVPGRPFWRDLALAFQYGDAFNEETGKYDVVDETKRIISFAAVEEPSSGGIILKVARLVDGVLLPLDSLQFAAFSEYVKLAKPMGVKVTIISIEGDDFRAVVDIYYDPLVLDANGNRLDGTGTPVPDTISVFAKKLPFNSEFVIASLVDALQATYGVKIPTILSAESKYLNNDWKVIDARVKPYAGYLNVKIENLTINYRPYDVG